MVKKRKEKNSLQVLEKRGQNTLRHTKDGKIYFLKQTRYSDLAFLLGNRFSHTRSQAY